MASFDEVETDLIANSACIIGCISSILVDVAMSGKKVCLVDAELPERYTGIPVTRDWFTRKGLRVSAEQAINDPVGNSLMTAESLAEFAPRYFNGEWFVEALEGIFDRFGDPEQRNALKYDLTTDRSISDQLLQIEKNSKSPSFERARNHARYEYCQQLTHSSEMLNLISPDMPNEEIVSYLKRFFSLNDLPFKQDKCRGYLEGCSRRFADAIVDEVYAPDRLSYYFDPPMYYDTPFLMPGYSVADALRRKGRNRDADAYESRLNKVFLAKNDSAQAQYANAVAFERMGRTAQALEMFKKLVDKNDAEDCLRAGAYFHMGTLRLGEGEKKEAERCFGCCLGLEQEHNKAKFYLEQLSSGKM